MLNLVDLLQQCEVQQAKMQADVFAFPPSDWAAFQNRLGQWQGVDVMRKFLERAIEDDKEKDSTL